MYLVSYEPSRFFVHPQRITVTLVSCSEPSELRRLAFYKHLLHPGAAARRRLPLRLQLCFSSVVLPALGSSHAHPSFAHAVAAVLLSLTVIATVRSCRG